MVSSDWLNGKRHGKGEYTWRCGDNYNGDWFAGKMQGFGTFTWANGDTYTGQWEQGKMNGYVLTLFFKLAHLTVWFWLQPRNKNDDQWRHLHWGNA